ncbi:pre-mRNA-splicing factor Isy1p [[Candida] railenensis]|uniref:Pre-mRNA-splicing factor ISY1 n=1 Tax=[Candida] railenensis TaxID=45579 RepID=A0A9P0VXY3_9ASCO|nr:pre-mRNA-splicing factor Isy1p [[Candida] railenensis]
MSAKNKEAQSGINRFLALKNREAGVLESNPNLRPKYVQKEQSIPQADKWRSVVLGEISTRLTKINDPTANEYQLRDLNDELNKLFKEKRAWEYHIRDLGGPDYISLNNKQTGTDLPGVEVNGYRYFGRAKELSDVKKVLEEREKHRKSSNKSRDDAKQEKVKFAQREARLDSEYYGFDEMEVTSQEGVVYDQVSSILQRRMESENNINDTCIDVDDLLVYENSRSKELQKDKADLLDPASDIVDEDIPTSEQVAKWLVSRRKRLLLAKLGQN